MGKGISGRFGSSTKKRGTPLRRGLIIMAGVQSQRVKANERIEPHFYAPFAGDPLRLGFADNQKLLCQ